MPSYDPDVNEVAAALRVSIGLFVRRLRQAQPDGELTLPETSALVRLDRGGPSTPGALAKLEQISPQSIGVTVAALEAKGLIQRSADPADGRRVIVSLTSAGDATVQARRSARDQQFTRALSALTAAERAQLLEVMPLLERLAEEL
jgi:DNA-binding MarR family transcriptional regulator